MATTRSIQIRAGRLLRLGACVLALATATAAGTHAHAAASSRPERARAGDAYGWPVKPFSAQHPVRGFFGDPRIGMTPRGMTHTFHFGIDISCPNGTPVYATLSGTVHLEAHRPETVSVRSADRRVEHQYWHIAPTVRHGQRVLAGRTVVGHVLAPWAHVHFAEMRDGRYVNPLRPGALGPYGDDTRPVIRNLRVERAGRAPAGQGGGGALDLVVEALDTTPLAVPGRWAGKPVTPSLLRWRLVRDGAAGAWRTAVDVRRTLPPNDRYDAVFARWTRQNKISRPGRYRFYLAHGLAAATLAARGTAVEVEASDTRGNRAVARFPLDGR